MDDEGVQALCAMGFDLAMARQALVAANNDVNRAPEILCGEAVPEFQDEVGGLVDDTSRTGNRGWRKIHEIFGWTARCEENLV